MIVPEEFSHSRRRRRKMFMVLSGCNKNIKVK
jgi:hypothetical protein